jgi:putative ABC transport system ATP-binding protein
MIKIENLEKCIKTKSGPLFLLRQIHLEIAEGDFLTVMGPSGAGKSTLLAILGLYDHDWTGEYHLDGLAVHRLSAKERAALNKKYVGFVFQQFHLLERVDALKNVMLPLIYADGDSDAAGRADRALAAVGLDARKHHHPSELSGGEQQRVAIARALVTDPLILLADEPTGNLDTRNGLEVLAIFQRLHREGRTLVMITHDRTVAEHARRLLVLQEGRVVQDQPIAQPREAETELRALSAEPAAAIPG